MPRRRSAEPRYRRRVVLELTPDESKLLGRLAELHGTIRGAVLVGLRELEASRTVELEAQVPDVTERLVAAEKAAADDRERWAAELTATTEQLASSRASLSAEQANHKGDRADAREARSRLSAEKAAGRAAQALQVHHVFCGVCDKLVPEAEWAEQPWREGFGMGPGRASGAG